MADTWVREFLVCREHDFVFLYSLLLAANTRVFVQINGTAWLNKFSPRYCIPLPSF